MAECRSCHASIVWGRTRNNVSMPLDAEPTENGNALLHADNTIDVLGPLELQLHDRGAEPLRLSHHVTCPDADSWSRKAKGGWK
jgi:hypothetical protein